MPENAAAEMPADEASPAGKADPKPRRAPRKRAAAPKSAEVVPLPRGSLAIVDGQSQWTDQQRAALAAIGLADVPEADQIAFLHLCERSGLDPWSREIYLIGRNETYYEVVNGQEIRRKRTKYTAQTGIDGFRHIAERSHEVVAKFGPFFCGPDGDWRRADGEMRDVWTDETTPPTAARFGILRKGQTEITWATALYREFVPLKPVYEGSGQARRKVRDEPTGLWPKMPAHMTAKCSEALCVRISFPRQASGLYLKEEMDQVDARLKAEADEERARARTDLVRAGWTRPDALTPGETVPADQVIDGEPEPPAEPLPSRAALLAEFEWQAEVLGKTVPRLASRGIAMYRCNFEDWTDEQLAENIASRRDTITSALAALPEDDPRRAGPKIPEPDAPADNAAKPAEPTEAPGEAPTPTPDDAPDDTPPGALFGGAETP